MSNAFLNKSELVDTPIQNGDAGIILKPDGSFQIFSTGDVNPKCLTQEQMAQGEKLMALTIALKVPQIMNMLMELASDPEVVGDKIVDVGRMN